MGRLTEKHSDGTYGLKIRKNISDMEMKWSVYDKLGKYEDAEEQGLLLRLPCKVGDTVYFIYHDAVHHEEVKRFFNVMEVQIGA